MGSELWAHLDQHRRVCEGVVEHGQHIRGGDDPGVVTPGGDQQPVVGLRGEKAEDRQVVIMTLKEKTKHEAGRKLKTVSSSLEIETFACALIKHKTSLLCAWRHIHSDAVYMFIYPE